MQARILLIDDEPEILGILRKILTREEYHVKAAMRGRDALELCQEEQFDLAISDIRMPEMDGVELMRRLKQQDPELEIIMLTGFATLDNAIDSLKANGAFDFLRKPIENIELFLHTIEQALEKRRLRIQNRELLAELAKREEHLEKLVEHRTSELFHEIHEHQQTIEKLKKAKEAAEAGNRAKSEFIASMSHEIRTPLNIILGFTQVLQSDSTLNQAALERLQLIEEGGNALMILLNDILTLSKLESDQLVLSRSSFRLENALKSVVKMTRLQAEQKGLSFHYEKDDSLPFSFYGDEERLRQVLFNLLGNAVKFSHKGGQIILRVLQKKQHSPSEKELMIRFEVQDFGIGIPQEHQERILEPFDQIDKLQRCTEGAGLGLAVSQRLLQMMGSHLQVESSVGLGSIFSFELTVPSEAPEDLLLEKRW